MMSRLVTVAVVCCLVGGFLGSPVLAGPDKAKDHKKEHRDKANRDHSPKDRQAALEKQKDRFEEIHAKRLAKLNRIRELAVEKGNDEMVAKVDRMIEKQHRKHAKKMGGLKKRLEKAAQMKDKAGKGHKDHDLEAKKGKGNKEHKQNKAKRGKKDYDDD